ncbi:hypothetical protein NCS52_01465600 [Fusarium sp. LHS14.1]|nr:hypothetical protein NCS52_01465600 [Fusarium sp. LHS14.1]
MSTMMSNEEHRNSSEDLRSALRTQEFRRLNKIQKKLDRYYNITEFDNSTLEKFSIVRGSAFNIDEDDPIDLDPRFFLPGPVENMEHGIDVTNESDFTEYCRWPQFRPIDNHRRRQEDQAWANATGPDRIARKYWLDDRLREEQSEARRNAWFCQRAAQVASSWQRHYHIKDSRLYCYKTWFSRHGGQAGWDYWHGGEYYRWHPGSDEMDELNPNVPHAVATVFDSSRPLHQGMLRSELRVAVGLLKTQIRWVGVYDDHCFYPVLVISFHGRFSARITQAYVQNDKVIVRPSRLINLHTPVISPEVRLVIRWLNSRPVGNTRFPISKAEQFDDPVAIKVETKDLESVPSETIAAQ